MGIEGTLRRRVLLVEWSEIPPPKWIVHTRRRMAATSAKTFAAAAMWVPIRAIPSMRKRDGGQVEGNES